jgi:hypothetical protein
MLAMVLGVSALAVEFGRGLFRHIENQRVADLAAYSGALVYNSTGSLTSAQSAVNNMVLLNGLTSSDASSSIVSSPNGDGNQAVQVVVTTSDPLYLAQVLTSNTTLPVSATGIVEMKAGTPACIIALKSSGTGVSLTGGTSISAPGCAVASNDTLTQGNCGVTITSPVVGYNSGTPPFLASGCSTFVEPPTGTPSVSYDKQTTEDPLADDPAVSTATSRLSSVEAITSPSAPSASTGSNIAFGYSTVSSGLPSGCTDSFSSPTHTLTCTGTGPFKFGNITLSGGITVNFNTGGSASAVYDFNEIDDSGSALHFGPGTYNIADGVLTGGGSTTSFGAGTFNIGKLPSSSGCPAAGYSICNGGSSLTFAGPSTFVTAGGIYPNSETIILGCSSIAGCSSGDTNSYDIGKSNDGYSIYTAGGGTIYLGDATGSGDLFETAGSIGSSGGSCMWLPAATNHDINGYISLAGGLTMGAGTYTVSDYFAAGASSGGDVTCNGSAVGVYGNGVTVVYGAQTTISSCGSQSGTIGFCLGAGFNHVTLVAPSSGTFENLAVIGPSASSGNTAAADFSGGATGTSVSGAFYLPIGPVTLDGGSSLGSGSGQCLELIAAQVSVTAGSAVTSTCAGVPQARIGEGADLVN